MESLCDNQLNVSYGDTLIFHFDFSIFHFFPFFMRNFILNKILAPYLAFCARRIIKLNRPIIIGITGSVGKSSAKEAIYTVVSKKFRARKNKGNLNNEIGLPLSVISDVEPKGDIFKWLGIIAKGLLLSLKRDRFYPKILILEMAVDRPGDMDYLTSIASPKIALITDIGVSHLEFFHDEKQILKEKAKIFKNIPRDGLAIFNFDNVHLRSLKKKLKKPILTYGFRSTSDVLAEDYKIGYSPELGEGVNIAKGVSFRVSYKTIFLPVVLPNIISKAQIYSALSGIAVGLHLGMNLVEITEQLKNFTPLPGRMRLIRGKWGNLIIDDTYNSAPNSLKSALETLALIKSKKKTVILGDMLELGKIESSAHREIGRLLFSIASKVVLVGTRMLETHKELKKLGFPKDKIHHYRSVTALIPKIPAIIGKGELILVKGSQGLRMEKAVEELVPQKSQKLLARQDKYWKRKKVREV